ncbi:MAG: M28 family peptidase, partial [Vicinamibacterales bacterium]|nr:M28 family peptidase [Vicinamibacterales bacterium]
MKTLRLLTFVTVVVLLTAPLAAQPPAAGAPGAPAISAAAIVQHVKVLASDEFEGRAPGTRGEDKTVAYIADQFAKVGLTPGNPDGTYFQPVPMVGITADPSSTFVFKKGGETRALTYKDDIVAWTKRVRDRVVVAGSDVVFVGYGVQAPEFQWDDYKGVDVAGKTVIMLVNDPPVPDSADASALDPKTFGGRAMTYYGRWTYKYEIGAEKKAAAVLIVHETGPAAYPFSVVQSKVTEQVDQAAADDNMSRVAVEGWITLDQAKALFAMAGQDFDALKARAATRAFTPVSLGLTAEMDLKSTTRRFSSRNVVGTFEGADPVLKHEYVIYTSHWDHYGIGPAIDGDTIYNGALDNATGIGGLIELGKAFVSQPVRPKRS